MKALEALYIFALWGVTGLNLWSLIRNIRDSKKARQAFAYYTEAAEDCIKASAAFEEARNNYIQATEMLEGQE